MIFVTVGTHEQPFNRLVKYMDSWALNHREEVVIQTGFSTFIPKNCKYREYFPYKEMVENVDKARIVITHGGPSSFIMPLYKHKVPIVVPRRKEFGEHVNNHQVDFCKQVAERQGNIIVIEDIEKLEDVLERYDEITQNMICSQSSNNDRFCDEFERIVEELVKR